MQENRQEKSPVKSRISQYLEIKGITQYAFYKDSGIARGILAQNTGISEDNIARFIAYAKDVSVVWLITGEGAMLNDEQLDRTPVSPTPPKLEAPPPPPSADCECGPNDAKRIADLEKDVRHLEERIADKDEVITSLRETIRERERGHVEREKYVALLEHNNDVLNAAVVSKRIGDDAALDYARSADALRTVPGKTSI